MPYDEPLLLPPRARVEPSAAIELSWLVIGCGHRNAVHTMAAELEYEVDVFWGDGERMLTELIAIAHQLGCATGWNIDALLVSGGFVNCRFPSAVRNPRRKICLALCSARILPGMVVVMG